jgi:hypothetical protein
MERPSPPSRVRCTRQRTAKALLSAQLLAAMGAWIANTIETETIVGSGPLLTIVGLAMAITTRPWYSWAALFVGLSAPAVCALGAFMIAVFQLGPSEANYPVTALLSIYLLCLVPSATAVFKGVLSQPPNPAIPSPSGWRYSLRTLLVLMTLVAILTVVISSIFELLIRDFPINFALFGIAAILSSVAVAWRFAKLVGAKKLAAGESPGAKCL